MITTTLRLPDDLARFLQETAREASMSVNAFLAQLLEQERAQARRRRLALDWAAYAAEDSAQDVGYALPAQADLVAEPEGLPYRSDATDRTVAKKPRSRAKR